MHENTLEMSLPASAADPATRAVDTPAPGATQQRGASEPSASQHPPKADNGQATAPALAQQVDPAVARLRCWAIIGLTVVAVVLLPALHLLDIIEAHHVNRIGRYLCFVLVALGIDLIWGYTGVLSLCQALFFCLGGYAIGMHLSLPAGGGDVRPEYNNIPQFFHYSDVTTLPLFWQPFSSLTVALAAGLLVPAAVAAVLGFFIFRSRVRGVYFAILTQAIAWAAFLAFNRNDMLLGGTNGLTNFNRALNQETAWVLGLYLATVACIAGAILACRHVTRSRFGRLMVAIRDNESRLRFAGYRPEYVKVLVFAFAGLLAGLGGILYVPQNGIITPNLMRVEDSIWMVIWVALGGRGRLWGAVFGAMVVALSYSMLTSDLPRAWPFIQGAMFIAVVLLFPMGLVGLWDRLEKEVAAGRSVLRVVIATVIAFAFVVAESRGWIGQAMRWPDVHFDWPWWLLAAALVALLAAALVALLARRAAVAAIPMGLIGVIFLADAVGIMPARLNAPAIFGLHWKYVLLIAGLALVAGYYALQQGGPLRINIAANVNSLSRSLGISQEPAR